ncbi:hypothetical protein Phum_PHUM303890 [Pediculus humanus corporis]|uniref:Protein takeout n=1 Tax=Pediculus humanus subsp. corporis TaxID=121224 RepID=E0VM81_PEDHC|nr:uncharacterized protein Phum_PHUM303890 [Pediculus humanus corporis]EEB14487.1 hypothetical protein Phum_PHUM303890 [Pediculus humanus corporis]
MKPIILENYTIDGYQGFGIKLFTYVKEISLDGKYVLKNFFIPGLFPVYGKGNLENLTADVEIGINKNFTTDKFQIDISKTDIKLDSSKVNLSNLFFDANLSNFVNQLISELIPKLFEIISNDGLEFFKPDMENFINKLFDCLIREMGNIDKCLNDIFNDNATE